MCAALVAVFLAWRDGNDEIDADAAGSDGSTPGEWGLPEPAPSGQTAYTDRGGAVTLNLIPASSIPEAAIKEAERRLAANFPGAVITGPPDLACNCHGWVFAGGHHWIGRPDVETILCDNGYRRAVIPRPGDVVIYRDAAGEAVHSGLVHAISGGTVEVESKWGYMYRVRHPVAVQPFADRWGYYRTERQSHVIQFSEPDTGGDLSGAE
jgi:hypothetical protein